ncbi:uncharacterized protein [Dermacentor albipictus]|uniref:uncharacterized protein isoform X3 n=1 Tax=Dermacentor albipictus TaxID=60249 RepID=UPI0038FD2B10
MTEQRNGGHTPPAFAFIDEPTPGTSREGGEDVSGTSDDYTTCLRLYLEAESEKPIHMHDPTICDGYINDAWKALNSRTDATDVNDASDSGSTNYTPVVTTGRADHAWPSTSRAGIEKVSSTTKDMASSSDDAWRYQLNTERRPITDQIYKLDGMLLEPEEGNSERCVVPVAMFLVDRMPYTGTPRNTWMTKPRFVKPGINRL